MTPDTICEPISTMQYVSAGFQYSLGEGDGKTLQVILHPTRVSVIDATSLCWCSPDLELRSKTSMFGKLFGSGNDLCDVINNNMNSPVIFSLSKIRGDQIYPINLDSRIAEKGMFVSKDCFLCASDEIVPQVKYWVGELVIAGRLPSDVCIHNSYYVEGVTGTMFLQAEGSILTKVLAAGESFLIDSTSLVAHSANCKIMVTSSISGFYTVVGPGTIFMSAQTYVGRFKKTTQQMYGMNNNGIANYSNLIFKMLVMVVSYSILTNLIAALLKGYLDGNLYANIKAFIDELLR